MKKSLRTLTFFSLCSFTMLFGSLLTARALGDKNTVAVQTQTWVQPAAVADPAVTDQTVAADPAPVDTTTSVVQNTPAPTATAVQTPAAVTTPVATPSPTPTPTPTPAPTPAPVQVVPPTPTPVVDNRCIVTINGNKYDVTQLRNTHSGPRGSFFQCNTDMTAAFQSEHGTNYAKIVNYKI